MKKFFLVIIVAVITSSCFTPKLVTFKDDEFVKVYDDVKGTQNDLYMKANEWMVSIFKDAKSIIQHSDKEEGAIIGKYLMKYMGSSNGLGLYGIYGFMDVYSIIDIRVKDDKARISIIPYDYSYNSMASYTKEDAKKDMEALAESFYQTLKIKKVEF